MKDLYLYMTDALQMDSPIGFDSSLDTIWIVKCDDNCQIDYRTQRQWCIDNLFKNDCKKWRCRRTFEGEWSFIFESEYDAACFRIFFG